MILLKKFWVLFLLTLIVTPVVAQYLRFGSFITHDDLMHATRISEYHKAFTVGLIPPRFGPDLLKGAGYPVFIINYHTAYWLGAALMELGFNQDQAFRVLNIGSYVVLVFGSFLFLKKISNTKGALLGALSIAYIPYIFADLFMRGAVSEVLAIALVPFCLLSVVNLSRKNWLLNVSKIALPFGLLFITHATVSIFIAPFCFLFGLVWNRNHLKATFFIYIPAIVWALALASFVLIPSLLERGMYEYERIYLVWPDHFLNLAQILHAPIATITHNSPFQLGQGFLPIYLLTLFFLIANKFKKKSSIIVYLLLITIVSIYFITLWSRFFWEHTQMLQIIVFPWRFMVIPLFSTGILIALLNTTRIRAVAFLICFLLIYQVFGSRHFIKPTAFPQEYVRERYQFITTFTEREQNPKGMDLRIGTIDIPEVSIVSGNAAILDFEKRPGLMNFSILAKSESFIQTNLLYFSGWRASINGKPVQITTDHPLAIAGLITVNVPAGNHKVKIEFKETQNRQLANTISAVSLGAWMWFAASQILRSNKKIPINRF